MGADKNKSDMVIFFIKDCTVITSDIYASTARICRIN